MYGKVPIPDNKLSSTYFDLWVEKTRDIPNKLAMNFPAAKRTFTFAETKAEAERLARAISNLWVELVTDPIIGDEDDPKALFCLPIPIPSVMLTMKLACPKLGITTYAVSHLQMAAYGREYLDNGNAKLLFVPDVILNDPNLGSALVEQVNDSDVECVIILSPTDYTPAQYENATSFERLFPEKLVHVISSLLSYDSGREAAIGSTTNVPAIYNTSGTTGMPKGIKVPSTRAATLYNTMYVSHPVFGAIRPDTDFFVTIPMHHPTSNEHCVTNTWLCGATLYLQPDYNKEKFPYDLLELRPGSQTLVAPEHAFQLLDCDLPEGSLSHIGCIQLGGSPVTPPVMRRLIVKLKWLGVQMLLFGYGTSEDGPATFTNDGDMDKDPLEITALDGVEYRIVDKDNKPVKPGELGRLQVKRNGCTYLGYFKRPDLDAIAYPMGDDWREVGDIAQEVPNKPRTCRIHDRLKYSYVVNGVEHPTFPLRDALSEPPMVLEVEAIKLNLEKRHAMVGHVVLTKDADRLQAFAEIMEACQALPEVERPIDIKFVEAFDTNMETGKRLKEHLPDDLDGYGVDGKNSFRWPKRRHH